MRILLSPRFLRAAKKLSEESRQRIAECIDIFQENWQDQRLKTHKLSGGKQEMWSFSVTSDIRVLFFLENQVAYFLLVGKHDDVY